MKKSPLFIKMSYFCVVLLAGVGVSPSLSHAGLISAIKNKVQQVQDKAHAATQKVGETLHNTTQKIGASITQKVGNVANKIATTGPIGAQVGGMINKVNTAGAHSVSKMETAVFNGVGKAGNNIYSGIQGVQNKVVSLSQTALDKTKNLGAKVVDLNKSLATGVYNLNKKAFDTTKNLTVSAFDKTKNLATKVVDLNKSLATGVYNLNKKAFDTTKNLTMSTFDKTKDLASKMVNSNVALAKGISNGMATTSSAIAARANNTLNQGLIRTGAAVQTFITPVQNSGSYGPNSYPLNPSVGVPFYGAADTLYQGNVAADGGESVSPGQGNGRPGSGKRFGRRSKKESSLQQEDEMADASVGNQNLAGE
jgi:hypothetical protein